MMTNYTKIETAKLNEAIKILQVASMHNATDSETFVSIYTALELLKTDQKKQVTPAVTCEWMRHD